METPAPSGRRQQIVAAAVALTTSRGWADVTMARLASEVGVSRQTVYNEIGSKVALAEEMVLAELRRFLELVDAAFDAHPDDLPAAIEHAARSVLEQARDNELLRAVVGATHGAETELLPLLTTHSDSLLRLACETVRGRVAAYDVPLPAERVEVVIDAVVRLVLSHVVQPLDDPSRTAGEIAWLAARVAGL